MSHDHYRYYLHPSMQYDPYRYETHHSWTQGWFAYNHPGYVKGLLLGAGITYLLTHPKVQKALIKGVVSLWTTIQGGIEEIKEQIQDIKAEMSMKTDESES